nr:glycosyltransferase [Streptomyces phaeoluteigriseus]
MSAGPLRIVRLANFVAPASGGLRTALRELGKGYRAAGHEPVLVVPGDRASDRDTEQGRVITLPGPLLPGTGGYRVLTDKRRVAGLLAHLAPDRLEVSDRTTLRWTGKWARRARVPAVMVSHETPTGCCARGVCPRGQPGGPPTRSTSVRRTPTRAWSARPSTPSGSSCGSAPGTWCGRRSAST